LGGHPSEDGPGGFCPDPVEGVFEPLPQRFRDPISQVYLHCNLIDSNEMNGIYNPVPILKIRPIHLAGPDFAHHGVELWSGHLDPGLMLDDEPDF
jgi:hypothetical protein